MKEEYLEVAKILRELLSKDKTLLTNYELLLSNLREKGVKRSDCQAIENAMKYKSAEIMNQVEASNPESVSDGCSQLEELLSNNHMQPGRIEFIVDIFSYALGWQAKAAPQQDILVNNSEANSPGIEDMKDIPSADEVLPDEKTWQCPFCGDENKFFYCENCGRKKPDELQSDSWLCVKCGKSNISNFCTACGTARPTQQSDVWICPDCGKENHGKFCTGCGKKR